MSVYIDCLPGWSVCFGESKFKDNMVCIRGGPTFAGHLECHLVIAFQGITDRAFPHVLPS